MKLFRDATIICISLLINSNLKAQQDPSCKVVSEKLEGSYTGECKNGLANGKGEAKGAHRYVGTFKNGMPDGTGTYYYDESQYYEGGFQNGIKEGKGEMHFLKKGAADSVIKGYWSADEYRGKKYTTYLFSTTETFDRTDINPSSSSGNTITIEIETTSGQPGGNTPGGNILMLVNLVSPSSSILKMTSKFESSFKSTTTYELISFPCKLFGTLSNGNTFSLDLYKAANWKVRLYKNI